jgi:hypothetical protein
MIDYTGLRKRPTFEGFVDYLANRQETIRYPDRFAKQIREHPYLTQLDSEGLWEMEELDKKRAEQEYKERTVRQVANQNNVSAQVIRAVASSASSPPPGQMGPQPGTQTGPQKGPGTRQFRTNAPPVSGDLAQKLTSLEQGLAQMASIEQDIARQRADDAKRDNEKKQQITQMVARNLGQQSSEVGVIPYISIATDEEDNPRSRSPKRNRKSAKTEDALMLQAEPQTGASSTPKRNRKSAKTEDALMLPAEPQTGASSSSSSGVRRPIDTKGDSPPRAKARAMAIAKAPPLAIESLTTDPKVKATPLAIEPLTTDPLTTDPKPKAKAKAKAEATTKGVKKDSSKKTKPKHRVEIDTSTDRDYYNGTNKTYIIEQILLRGYIRETKSQLGRHRKPQLLDLLMPLTAGRLPK